MLELASRKGYQPALRPVDSREGVAGRSQKPGKRTSRFVGVVFYGVPGPSGPDMSGIGYLAGLSEASQAYDVSLVVHRFSGDSVQLLDPAHQPAAMREGFLEGLILIHRLDPAVVCELAKQYPIVTLTHFVHAQGVDHVDMNHSSAISRLVDQLHAQGHRRFGFLGREPRLAYNQSRFGSFTAAMARLGLPLEPAALVNVFSAMPDLDATADYVAGQIRAGVTAWVGVSDFVAYDLWKRLESRGLHMPRDASITGFDGLQWPLFGCPQVATARVPFEEMGGAALTRMLARIKNPVRPARQTLLECEHVVGESTGPVRTALS